MTEGTSAQRFVYDRHGRQKRRDMSVGAVLYRRDLVRLTSVCAEPSRLWCCKNDRNEAQISVRIVEYSEVCRHENPAWWWLNVFQNIRRWLRCHRDRDQLVLPPELVRIILNYASLPCPLPAGEVPFVDYSKDLELLQSLSGPHATSRVFDGFDLFASVQRTLESPISRFNIYDGEGREVRAIEVSDLNSPTIQQAILEAERVSIIIQLEWGSSSNYECELLRSVVTRGTAHHLEQLVLTYLDLLRSKRIEHGHRQWVVCCGDVRWIRKLRPGDSYWWVTDSKNAVGHPHCPNELIKEIRLVPKHKLLGLIGRRCNSFGSHICDYHDELRM
jgi:hypothetical protein